MFRIDTSNPKGFHVKFANGNTLSVQWGSDNYCSRKWHGAELRETINNGGVWSSEDCEILAVDKHGHPHYFDGIATPGQITPDVLAQIMMWVSTNELETRTYNGWSWENV